MDITPRRRRALSTVLALLLAVESVSAVAAAAQVNITQRDGAARALAAASTPVAPTAAAPVAAGIRAGLGGAAIPDFRLPEPAVVAPAAVAAPKVARAEVPQPAAKTQKVSTTPKAPKAPKVTKVTKTTRYSAPASPATYKGRNHLWIPSLRINRSVAWFPCDRSRPPDNYVYRWGCAGANNVYLLGHAYSVFKPLHDAYVNHRLRVGMKAYYADGSGKVRAYAIKWWKLTLPTPDAAWAWAAQSRPSMTLQTCVGPNNKYRLMVRLVQVGG